jgi:hypothetical protein
MVTVDGLLYKTQIPPEFWTLTTHGHPHRPFLCSQVPVLLLSSTTL